MGRWPETVARGQRDDKLPVLVADGIWQHQKPGVRLQRKVGDETLYLRGIVYSERLTGQSEDTEADSAARRKFSLALCFRVKGDTYALDVRCDFPE